MSKKNYQDFATLIGRFELPAEFVQEFTDMLKQDNSRFDRDRFAAWVQEVKNGERNKYTGKRQKAS